MAVQPETYPSLHHVHDLDSATSDDLTRLIETFPVIDNHAHNILTEEQAYGNTEYPFECITSEAHGHALTDHVHTSLPHIRGIKHLAEFYQCPPTLADVKAARYEWVRRDYAGLVRKCFEGIHGILMDDGLAPSVIKPFRWHRQFLPTVSRIVRVEAIAAELLENLAQAAGLLKVGLDADWDINQTESFLVRFNTVFRNQIRTLANDPDVCGFKSVVCYRSGLDIALESRKNFRPHQSLTESTLLTSFHSFIRKAVRNNNYRIQQKEVNDYLVVAVCDVLDKLVDTDGENLPFQFHTGLGDTDINLVKANPAYMQPLIEAFPNVDFVILHSSYPYTREAGYLAANYVNAWLDIGEVYPMLSRDGQESVLREALELTPTSKILWSTDGHFYPESYWLANRQFRSVLTKVLGEYVAAQDMTVAEAIDAAVDILFFNSNALYRMDEERKYPELLRACGRSTGTSVRTLTNGTSKAGSYKSSATTAVDQNNRSLNSAASSRPLTSRPASAASPTRSRTETPISPEPVASIALPGDDVFESFIRLHPNVKYIWLQFLDYTATMRARMIPVAQFRKQLASGRNPGVTKALPRLLQDDNPAIGCTASGQFLVAPDLSTLCINKGIDSPSATVQSWWMQDTDDVLNQKHWDRCPRHLLNRITNAVKSEFDIDLLLGFEVEVVFMRPVMNDNKSDFVEFEPLSMVHSWANLTYPDLDILPFIEEIVENLAAIGIELPQFHAEAAPGQWEFPLPAHEPVKAVDVLFRVKEVIRNLAHKRGLKATFYPRPYNFTAGSGCHAHFSVNGSPGIVEKYADAFLAGVLENLPAVLAFTLPVEESYARVMAGIWSGGEYVCWGTQNREAPLRKCGAGHWELKMMDGMANAYLGASAIFAAGLYGLRQALPLELKDNIGDATAIGEAGRAELGIVTKLPNSIEASLFALKHNEILQNIMGKDLVEDYMALKGSENAKLRDMGDQKRRVWLMARY